MRAAVIDVGTNTFNILIGERKDNQLHILHTNRIPVKLGEGGIEKGYISYRAFVRGVEAMTRHAETLREYGVQHIHAVATSATRSALNGPDFVCVVQETTGIEIQVIDGEREADLIYKGIKVAMPGNQRMLAMDIGGGSTEFIIGEGNRILWKCSTQLGVSRLMGMFRPEDPYTEGDIQVMEDHFRVTLLPLAQALVEYPCELLVGSSGSFETFSAMILDKQGKGTSLEGIMQHNFSVQEFQSCHEWLIRADRKDRLNHPAIAPIRVDMIGAGSLLTNYVVNLSRIEHMATSAYALKEGLLMELLQ